MRSVYARLRQIQSRQTHLGLTLHGTCATSACTCSSNDRHCLKQSRSTCCKRIAHSTYRSYTYAWQPLPVAVQPPRGAASAAWIQCSALVQLTLQSTAHSVCCADDGSIVECSSTAMAGQCAGPPSVAVPQQAACSNVKTAVYCHFMKDCSKHSMLYVLTQSDITY
jgi:hypothetical protein